MTLSITLTVRKVLFLQMLYAAVATETYVSAGFSIRQSSIRQHSMDHPRYNAQTRGFGRIVNPNLSQNIEQSTTEIRGGGRQDKDSDEEQLKDFGGAVAGLFGNLRIPASLIAGASLGSAFALPTEVMDGPMLAFSKRMYAFSMLTSLGSMLLVVILSTICMNDIAIRPGRYSKSVHEYIEENYSLEWFTVKSNFFYGALIFVVGAAFRAWVSIACPVFGKGIVGILLGMTLISFSNLVEKSKIQGGGRSNWNACARHMKEVAAKAKTNPTFAAGFIVWMTSVGYLIVKIPHMYRYFLSM